MRVLLENTTFPLHKIVRIAGIIRAAGIIQGRALYEEIRYNYLQCCLTVHGSFDSLHSARSGFGVAAIFLQEST